MVTDSEYKRLVRKRAESEWIVEDGTTFHVDPFRFTHSPFHAYAHLMNIQDSSQLAIYRASITKTICMSNE